MVALKLGADGVLVGASGVRAVLLPTRATSVIDSTGAGDAFAAGFLAAWLASNSPVDAASAGLAAAARAVATMGGRPGLVCLPGDVSAARNLPGPARIEPDMRSQLARSVGASVVVAGLLATAGCGSSSSASGQPSTHPATAEPVVQTVPATPDEVVAADDGFAASLLPLAGAGNVVLSPLSITTALQMVLQGARGETGAQLRSVLHLADNASAAAGAGQLAASLAKVPAPTQLSIADTIWLQQGLSCSRTSSRRCRMTSRPVSSGSTSCTRPGRRQMHQQDDHRPDPGQDHESVPGRLSTTSPGWCWPTRST